jgi:uncharacterized protein YkwD
MIAHQKSEGKEMESASLRNMLPKNGAMQRLAACIAAVCLVAALWASECLAAGVASAEGFTVYCDSQKVEFDVPPAIANDRLMVPLRKIGEMLGADVSWDDSTKTASVNINDIAVELSVGNKEMLVKSFDSRSLVELDSPPIIIESRTLVPLRAISSAFDADVSYDEESKTVLISRKKAEVVNVAALVLLEPEREPADVSPAPAPTPTPESPKPVIAPLSPSDNPYENIAKEVVSLVNAARSQAGLNPLSDADDKLRGLAQTRVEEIKRAFSHLRPDGRRYDTAFEEAGIFRMAWAENIAYGQSTPQAVMNAWMSSDNHRANILNPNMTHLNIGVAPDSMGRYYWTQDFYGN